MNAFDDDVRPVRVDAARSAPVTPSAAAPRSTAEGQTLSVIVEDVSVTARERETGGVRVRIEATERRLAASGAVTSSTVEVERVERGQVVTETRGPWQDGDALVVPVYRDEWVQVRQLVLVEEVRLRTLRRTEMQSVDVPLREERAVIERQGADGVWRAVSEATPTGGSRAREDPAV